MAWLIDTVRTEIEKYAGNGEGLNCRLFFVGDELHQMYVVLVVDHPIRKFNSSVVVFARIIGDLVIIEEDTTDKPLVDALMQQGIPRQQIILVYQGEPVPDPIDVL